MYWGRLQKNANWGNEEGSWVQNLILTYFPLYAGGGVFSIIGSRHSLNFLVTIFFDLVLSSPSERTQSTSDLVLSYCNPAPTILLKEDIYHASVSSLSQLIKGQDDSINDLLVIGHNPGLHILIETLAHESIIKLPTCTFVKLTNFNHWKDLDTGILDLELLITPKELKHDWFKSKNS